MKIAVTSTGPERSSRIDPRFGRTRCFVVVDSETNESTAHDNAPNLNAAQGAGIQAAQAVARLGAEAVITGHVGPKAYRVLKAAGISIRLCDGGTVSEAVSRFKAGELAELAAADVEGHWA